MGKVGYRVTDGIAVVVLINPPTNALGADIRAHLSARLSEAIADETVDSIVLGAEGGLFCSGIDIREIGNAGTSKNAPDLSTICLQIEESTKPVFAAVQGNALGGGAELALAAHYRLAAPETRIGLPEITLGVIPGCGGTQRLPRLVGAEAALNMLLSGRTVTGKDAKRMGLVDGLVNGDVLSAAFATAQDFQRRGRKLPATRIRRAGFKDPQLYMKAVIERRQALKRSRYFAPGKVVDCVEAAFLLPFEAGLAFEETCFEDCLEGPQSKALRHAFLAERKIDRLLLEKTGTAGWTVTEAGALVVDRLGLAFRAAIDHIASLGPMPIRIDSALLDFGFTKVPFGNKFPESKPGEDIGRIQRRVVAALMAEGARLVEKGVVARASDIDALAIHGIGFPRWRGGPMKAAELFGLAELSRDMERWAEESRIWSAPALLTHAAKDPKGFGGFF